MALNDETEMVFAEDVEVDPVSGNEVPPGSMPEEVRDDIDARLSEGEYVVPADVLRYYGVKFFEDLRVKAKMDLARMDREGRIGGQPVEERAEGLPFMVSELEVTEVPEMAAGGLYDNINARKKAGTSRSKEDSTISDEAYAKMKRGFDSGGDAGQSTIQDWYDNWLKDNSVTQKMSDSNKISTVPFINEEGKVIYVQYRGAYDPLSPETNALSAIPTGYIPKPADAADAGASSDISDAKPEDRGPDVPDVPAIGGVGFTSFKDTIDGGGPGAIGDTFQGGLYSGVLNSLGITPYGWAQPSSTFGPGNNTKTPSTFADLAKSGSLEMFRNDDGSITIPNVPPPSVMAGSNFVNTGGGGSSSSTTGGNSNQGNPESTDNVDFSQGPPGYGNTAENDNNSNNDYGNFSYYKEGGVAKKYTKPKKPKYTKGGFVSRRTKK